MTAHTTLRPVFNDPRLTRFMNPHDAFDDVLFVAHHEWHGIRHCTAYCPGQKLLIPAEQPFDEAEFPSIVETIADMGIRRIVFHGYSENADRLALYLHATLGPSVPLYAVTHVTTTQFEHYFEMVMQARLGMRLRYGTFARLGSVKPGFGATFPEFWDRTIVNFAPNLGPALAQVAAQDGTVFIPLDVSWRKNLYACVMGGLLAKGASTVWTTNFPNGLESLTDLSRLRLVGYLRGVKLFAKMGEAFVVCGATLAECQPMTQLEAYAVGTPVLTGPLGLDEFADDPLMGIAEVSPLDSPPVIAKAIDRLIDMRRSDEAACQGMIADHLARRHALAFDRYAAFLDL